MTENAKEALCKLAEELKEIIDEFIEPIQEAFDKLAEELTSIEYEEQEKYEPCYKLLSPTLEIYSHKKLWRENRALFRPYKAGGKSGKQTQRRVTL